MGADGVVVGVAPGTCVVTAAAPSGASAECRGTVTPAGDSPYAGLDPAVLYGRSLILQGTIGMNVYFAIPDEVRSVDGAHVRVTDAAGAAVAELPVSQAVRNGSYSGVPIYAFAAYMPAKQMGQGLTFSLVSGDGWPLTLLSRADGSRDITAEGFTCTVGGYYEGAVAADPGHRVVPLLRAMLLYGARSKAQFGVGGPSAADVLDPASLAALEAEAAAVDAGSLAPYAAQSSDGDAVSYYGGSLTLESATYINIYFRVRQGSASDYAFLVDGEPVEPRANGSYWCVTRDDIAAADLDEAHVFEVVRASDGEVCASVTYSALSYAYSVLSSDRGTEALRDTVRALRVYSEYANVYFGR